MRTITRDPFAGVALVRSNVRRGQFCEWCGRPARYRYGYDHDHGPVRWARGVWCSLGCFRSWH